MTTAKTAPSPAKILSKLFRLVDARHADLGLSLIDVQYEIDQMAARHPAEAHAAQARLDRLKKAYEAFREALHEA